MLLAALSADAVHGLIAAWLFALGGVVGSFLNVVVCRLPAGMSLVEPGSHCPACKHPIRWFDNVPILGWIVLRGRCRDCGARISPRYPVVEAITASLFLVLGLVELLGDRTTLPAQCGIYSYHLLLLCTLLAAVLIEYDKHRPPWRLFLPAIIGGACTPLIWPGLRPVSAVAGLDGWMAGLADGAAGLAAGAVLAALPWLVFGTRERTGIVPASACVGLFLGWQAAAVLIVVATAIYLPLLAVGRMVPGVRRIPPTTWLALGSLGWILGWAPLVARFPMLG